MPPADLGWNTHFRTIQITGSERKISVEEVKQLLKGITEELQLDTDEIDNPLIHTDETDRARARTLFRETLARDYTVNLKPEKGAQRAICLYCASDLSANSSIAEIHIATACCRESHPQFEPCVRKVASGKSGMSRLGKKLRDAVMADYEGLLEQDKLVVTTPPTKRGAEASASASVRMPSGKRAAVGVNAYMDPSLNADRVAVIDQALARFIYASGLPLDTVRSSHLREMLHLLNASYLDKSRVTDWNVRNGLLSDEHERLQVTVEKMIEDATAITVVTDGWSGCQKKHLVNILFCTKDCALFMGNFFTDDKAVTGEYQFELYKPIMKKYEKKVVALCTDNAAVMQKTWRLLREEFPWLFTYGCAAHGFNLLAKDICHIAEFKQTIADAAAIVNYFNNHLGAGGMATLQKMQQKRYGKTIALVKPTAVRWNSQVDSALSLEKSEGALVDTVKDPAFKLKDPAAAKIKALVLEKDNTDMWRRLRLFIDLLASVRMSILVVQSQYATLADVYACFVAIYTAFHSEEMAETVFEEDDTLSKVHELLDKRIDFLIHPLHIVSFSFHPLYANVDGVSRAVARKWFKECFLTWKQISDDDLDGLRHAHEALDRELDFFYGRFMVAPDYAHCWRRSGDVYIDPVVWAQTHLDEAPNIRLFLTKIFACAATASAAERNWSTQNFIVSQRRSRLTVDRANMLVAIYFNLRALDAAKGVYGRASHSEVVLSASASTGFPHPSLVWMPFSNWRSSDRECDDEMYGDDGEEVVEDDDEARALEADDDVATDWVPPVRVFLKPCPQDPRSSVKKGDKVVVWFGGIYCQWYLGTVVRVDRRCVLPVTALFDDGEAPFDVDPALYGTTGGREWALLQDMAADAQPAPSTGAGAEVDELE